MILESDLHNEYDSVRSTRAEGSQKPGKQELGKATRYGREPFRNCFRFAWGHNSIQLRGNVSFPRESRGMIYIRDGRQKTCPPPASHKAAPLAAARGKYIYPKVETKQNCHFKLETFPWIF